MSEPHTQPRSSAVGHLAGSSRTASPRVDGGHLTVLDGIRGLAILLVFLYDCLRPAGGGPINYVVRRVCTAGWIGVDLFFVLSGFLITGILLDTAGRRGYFSSFFLRRSVRIFPLYYLALAVTFIGLPWYCRVTGAVPDLQQGLATLSADQWWYWTYLQNWLFAFRQAWPEPQYLKHFWSLAIEEQFYLVWPFVVAMTPRRWMAPLCLGLIGTALATRTALYLNGFHWVTTFAPTVCRLDGLAMGGLAATLLRDPVWRTRLARWSPWFFGIALPGLFVLDKVWPVLVNDRVGTHTIGHTLFAVIFAALVVTAATRRPEQWLSRALSIRSLTLLGQLSYGLYVLHRPVHRFVESIDLGSVPEGVRSYAVFAATLALSLAAASLSWVLVERPLLGLKRYFPRPDQQLRESRGGGARVGSGTSVRGLSSGRLEQSDREGGMSQLIRLAAVSDIAPGGRLSVEVDETPALLLRAGDDFYCLDDVCTHDGQPLTDGPFDGQQITCPRHGAKFDVRTGKPTCMPATSPVRVYPVTVQDGFVFVSV